MKATALTTAALVLSTVGVQAQERLAPNEIVAKLQDSGHISGLMGDLVLHGCPPDGPSRAVFTAVSNAALPASVLSELAVPWGIAYTDCDYGPLEAWFERALNEILLSGDRAQLSWFVDHMPVDISPRMRQSLWLAATSQYTEGRFHDLLAARAVRSSDLDERLSLTVGAIRDQPVTVEWIYGEGGSLLREAPGAYVSALVGVAASLNAERLLAVLGSVNGNVSAGLINANSGEVNALRRSVSGRADIPAAVRDLRGQR